MEKTVSIMRCENYERQNVEAALTALLQPLGALEFVHPGMKIVLKVNLVGAYSPKQAATTHPELVAALCRRLLARGAQVIIGDSPGGLFQSAIMEHIYEVTGLKDTLPEGAVLNRNYDQKQILFPEAYKAKSFAATAFLSDADMIINICKVKTHGMMGMSCGVKNLFGAIYGTQKMEHHFRYARSEDFADMLLDLSRYYRPVLTIADAVICMEGNGPTKGTPKHTGLLLASQNPHALDLCCAYLMGIDPDNVPTLARAMHHGLLPRSIGALTLVGTPEALIPDPFLLADGRRDLQFSGKGLKGRIIGYLARSVFIAKPNVIKKDCILCGKCLKVCPTKALALKNGAVYINRKSCIRCFCCQEFCPTGAMRATRSSAAKLLDKI